jgi:hypothetical protein
MKRIAKKYYYLWLWFANVPLSMFVVWAYMELNLNAYIALGLCGLFLSLQAFGWYMIIKYRKDIF